MLGAPAQGAPGALHCLPEDQGAGAHRHAARIGAVEGEWELVTVAIEQPIEQAMAGLVGRDNATALPAITA